MKLDAILVLDFGHYCYFIGRRVHENSVHSEIVPYNITPKRLEALKERHAQ